MSSKIFPASVAKCIQGETIFFFTCRRPPQWDEFLDPSLIEWLDEHDAMSSAVLNFLALLVQKYEY
jgi:hypothetical protein